MNEVNEHIIQFRGKASIDTPLILDHDYKCVSTITCRRISTSPTDDGMVDTTYTVEPVVSEITDDLGKVVEVKKKSKISVAMRFLIIGQMRELFPDGEDEDNYEKAMAWIMNDMPQILSWLNKKHEND